MKKSSIGNSLVAACVLALPSMADNPNGSEPGSLAAWEWYQEVVPFNQGELQQWIHFVLTPDVFDHSRPDLGDLRLVDAQDRMVPYALRVRRAIDERRPLTVREFNRTANGDRSVEVSLDLGDDPVEHNEITVETDGMNFRRRLLLEGSADGKKWSTLLDRVWLVSFRVDAHRIDVHRHAYPISRFRYLRVHVFPDLGLDDDTPAFNSLGVFRTMQMSGEDITQSAILGPREPVRAASGPGSAWRIEFGGKKVPCERLTLDVSDDEFARAYELELADPDQPRQTLARGDWIRREGEAPRPLEILFQEVNTRRLRLVVTDYRNPPLNIEEVRYSAPVREVIVPFRPSRPAPLRLYYGNSSAEAPRYDFAASLPLTPVQPASRARLGPVIPNPEYRPAARPWTERWPLLVYIVLGAASFVLLLILIALGREAIRQQDAKE